MMSGGIRQRHDSARWVWGECPYCFSMFFTPKWLLLFFPFRQDHPHAQRTGINLFWHAFAAKIYEIQTQPEFTQTCLHFLWLGPGRVWLPQSPVLLDPWVGYSKDCACRCHLDLPPDGGASLHTSGVRKPRPSNLVSGFR